MNVIYVVYIDDFFIKSFSVFSQADMCARSLKDFFLPRGLCFDVHVEEEVIE